MQKSGPKLAIRYGEAFKMQVVKDLDSGKITAYGVRRKYGISGNGTIAAWVQRYGNGSYGKVVRVESPKEIDEKAQLRKRVRDLERALADANIDLALERQYTRIACEAAGISDVVEFKKKRGGTLGTKP